MAKLNFKKLPLLVDIMLRIIVVVALSTIVVVSYMDYASRELITDSAKNFTKKQDAVIFVTLEEFITSLKRVSRTLESMYSELGINNSILEKEMINIVDTFNNVDMCTLYKENDTSNYIRGYQNYNLKNAKNYSDHAINNKTKYISISNKNDKVTKTFYTEDLEKLNKVDNSIDDINAKTYGKSLMSDAFMLFGLPYVNYVVQLNGKNEKAELQIGVNLKELSLILNSASFTDRTRVFILNSQDQIIADSDVVERDKFKTVKEENNDILLMAMKMHETKRNLLDKICFFNVDGMNYFSIVRDMPKSFNLNWRVVTIVPTKDFLENFGKIEKSIFILSVFVILLVIAFLYFQIQKLSEPLLSLAVEANKIKNLELDDPVVIDTKLQEVSELATSMNQLKTSVANFSKFIPKGLIRKFIESGREVGIEGKSENLTIFFSDIANFTTITESTPANELTIQLSEYFEAMTNVLLQNNGTIDKFIGDAVMAFWGAPDLDDKQTYNACRAALICQQQLKSLNKYWISKNRCPLITRIGINNGTVVVGNIGSSERLNYTVLGDSVNLASRLEAINKNYSTNILVSESIVTTLSSDFIVRPVDIVAVKGKNEGIKIFELVGLDNDSYLYPVSEEVKKSVKEFTDAFNLYLAQKWKEALEAFTALQVNNVNRFDVPDHCVTQYIERCTAYIKNPPPAGWDGVNHLKEK